MISLKKIIHKLLLFFFVQLLIGNYSLAGSIPAFCMFNYGFFKNDTLWSNACTEKYTIVEYRAGSGFPAATYSLNGNNTIVEYRAGSGFPAATYSLNGNN